MLPGQGSRKAIAATFLLLLFTQTFAPTVSYALTSGPTQPEATSFEPIDTTDMVNLLSGNLSYNVPVLEVPGPEGGYPLSLSYHAGIQTNTDASWVGLGWTLNPGTINRYVNGYPDDWVNPKNTTRTYWSGGTVSTYQVGVSIGLYNTPLSVTAGLSFSHDTYTGFGTGLNFGAGIGGSIGIFSAGLGVRSNGAGGSLGGGIGLRSSISGGLNETLGVNASTNFQSTSVGFHATVSYYNESLLGTSIATNSTRPSVELGGLTSSVSSTSSPTIQTQSSGFGFAVPLPVPGLSLALGYSKTRYHTDETTTTYTQGSLYSTNAGNGNTIPDNQAFDTYSLLLDPSATEYRDFPDPTLVQGGSFPAFDDYEVNAQGLGGTMRPYQFQGQVFGQNRAPTTKASCSGQPNCSNYYCQYFSPKTTADPMPQFRFTNDFSNSYRQAYPGYSSGQITDNATLNSQTLPLDATPVFGNGDGSYGYSNNQLAGSRQVDMGIKVKPYRALGYNKTDQYQTGMIEGFTITNESGVTYTFGLPAYSYNEEAYQIRTDTSNGHFLNRQTKNAPYAYTWYLTSITGPDWVDRNGDGQADDGDWGYWVDFEYGKWSSDYIWRNPSEGYNQDEDNEWQNCSQGHREVYYLNAIRTRSHVALFEKDVRADAKGGSTQIFNKNTTSQGPYYTTPGLFDNSSVSSLELTHIYLLNASDENYVTPASNVLLASDVDGVGRGKVEGRAIRVTDFGYDNSLCPGTSNSFTTVGQLQGKLTLQYVNSRGKQGISLIPPIRFQYDLGNSAVTQGSVTINPVAGSTSASFTSSNGNFNQGDMIAGSSGPGNPIIYCGVIAAKSPPSGGVYTYSLVNSNIGSSAVTLNISTTKNPPYNKDAYDAWGMYKSDISTAQLASDMNVGRATSPTSAVGTDAWSLRGVTTQLGSQLTINYEPDSYFNSSAEPNQPSLVINQMTLNPTASTMTLSIDKGGNNAIHLADSYNIGDNLNAMLLQEFHYGLGVAGQPQDGTDGIGSMITDTRATINATTFSDVEDNIIPSGGYGYNVGYYTTQSAGGTWSVQAIDDINNTITVHCPSSFLMGNSGTTITTLRPFGGVLTGVNGNVYLSNSYGGNLFIKNTSSIYGGGIRVKSVSLLEQASGEISSTNYGYNDNTGMTSGISSYTPSMAQPCFNFPPGFSNFFGNTHTTVAATRSLYYQGYRRVFYNNNNNLFALAREIPPPGVMYGAVSVAKQIKNTDESVTRNIDGISKTQYQFEVFKGNMVGRLTNTSSPSAGLPVGQAASTSNSAYTQSAQYYALDKFLSCVGNVKSIIEYDNNGNKLKETDNHYLHDNLIASDPTADAFMPDYKSLLLQYNYQGYIQERFSEVKLVGQQTLPGDQGMKATISGREEYPCIPIGQTVINYVNGVQTNSTNLKFDFYSGKVTLSSQTDGYGNNVLTQTVPAYTVPQYAAMGLKVSNANNKNMLTQTAGTYMWKADGSNTKQELISASVNTWGDNGQALDPDGTVYTQNNVATTGDVWRQISNYRWLPSSKTTDGLTAMANFTDFNWATPSSSDPGWKNVSNVTQYDVYSKALEANDINGNYSATRLGYGEQKVVLSGSAANYYELAFSGAEDDAIGKTSNVFVRAGDGTIASGTGVAHTGAQSLLLGVSGKKGFLYSVPTTNLVSGRTYQASVWVKPTSGTSSTVQLQYDISGAVKQTSASSGSSVKTANGWSLINLIINGSDIAGTGTLNVYCINNDASVQAYADDFRFQPINANTTAYVYDTFSGELTYTLDNNNIYTKYVYDGMGRLASVYKEKLLTGVFKTNDYQYNYSTPGFLSSAIVNGYYAKNDCGSGYIGSTVYVSLPQGAFTSYLSQPDAEELANWGAQNLANQQGVCQVANTVVVTVPAGSLVSVSFNQGSTFIVGKTFAGANGTILVPSGTYTVNVSETNNQSHTVTAVGYGSQTGTSATFTSIPVPGLSLISVN